MYRQPSRIVGVIEGKDPHDHLLENLNIEFEVTSSDGKNKPKHDKLELKCSVPVFELRMFSAFMFTQLTEAENIGIGFSVYFVCHPT